MNNRAMRTLQDLIAIANTATSAAGSPTAGSEALMIYQTRLGAARRDEVGMILGNPAWNNMLAYPESFCEIAEMAIRMMAESTVGFRVRRARTWIDFTPGMLASLIGVTRAELESWEGDLAPVPDDALRKIARHCRVALNWLESGQLQRIPAHQMVAYAKMSRDQRKPLAKILLAGGL